MVEHEEGREVAQLRRANGAADASTSAFGLLDGQDDLADSSLGRHFGCEEVISWVLILVRVVGVVGLGGEGEEVVCDGVVLYKLNGSSRGVLKLMLEEECGSQSNEDWDEDVSEKRHGKCDGGDNRVLYIDGGLAMEGVRG